MNKSKNILVLSLLLASSLFIKPLSAQYTIPAKMNWWYEARFGMFIHFGSYSYFGHGEWVLFNEKWSKQDYQTKITANFKPDNFDAKQIVDLAKAAGMKYIVITAKHHEGFTMWKTEVQSFKDYKGEKLFDLYHFAGFQRNILQELKDECDNQGLKFCLYYSIMDWDHSSQTVSNENYYSVMNSMQAKTEYINDMKSQLREIITRYHPAVVWFDGDWCKNLEIPTLSDWWNKADAVSLYDFVTGLDSNILVNERVKRDLGLGDFMCPEQKIPAKPLERQWETCQTLNNSWGYDSRDSLYKSVATLVQELIQIVSRDGNYLLNIGPKGDGSIPVQTIEKLTEFGKWMNVYSDCIYGATRSPFELEPTWGYFTKKEGKLFACVTKCPSDGILKIPKLKNAIKSVYELSNKSNIIPFTKDNQSINIQLPKQLPNNVCSVFVIEVDGMPSQLN